MKIHEYQAKDILERHGVAVPKGEVANTLEEALEIAKLVFMASQAGGMEIEEVAAKDPDAIFKAYIDPAVGFQPYQARKLAFALGLKPAQINEAVRFMTGLYKVFLDTDASLLEINPFITTTDDRLVALDCKINFEIGR